ncbi:MAG: intradiol ring-cleavage dioxygenase [Leptolyngbyaceae cyanobacterium SM1_1_3]|nr:intradiol ring-cleavage dioxygenase [Leptolyngbyaceae cyanobacterium SM1_1_3]NJN01673.1 intradiol ring-cleavage dioxygenase [Leptolyngbyaceae cyanobacterium RM1_1_2]
MSPLKNGWHSRRRLLKTGPFFLGSFALAACRQRFASSIQANERPALAQNLPPTPACGDDPTPSQTAGPFYTPNSPERTSLLEPGGAGTPIILTGQVLSTRCTPIAGALVDVWHTNAKGEYDNRGYTFRGHQFTDAEGRYQLETIAPGLYPGRTRHIHVRVQSAHQPALTTQLYFPNEPLNEGDFLYRPDLLMSVDNSGVSAASSEENRPQAQFNFVLMGDS